MIPEVQTPDIYLTPATQSLYLGHQLAVLNTCTAKLAMINFHPFEVVSRYRDPQLQVGVKITHICLI